MMQIVTAAGVVVAMLGQPDVHDSVAPRVDIDWVVVGDPGNPSADPETLGLAFTPFGIVVGDVDYTFEIATVPITVEQWFDFLQVYWPYHEGYMGATCLTGLWIYADDPGAGPGEDPGYRIFEGAEEYPADVCFPLAARYCNWLHNGRVNEAWAFEDGAYDVSMFTQDMYHAIASQESHRPDARVWIPTLNEWIKAAYWDPDRFGPGKGGYWNYPYMSEKPPIPGLPGDPGAQSNGGLQIPLPVGSYPWAMSAWGLLDLSGGEVEHTETFMSGFGRSRWAKSGDIYDPFLERRDQLDGFWITLPSRRRGFRLARPALVTGSDDR